jgi:hypothetical protein
MEDTESKKIRKLMIETVDMVQGKTRLHAKAKRTELVGFFQAPIYSDEE